MNEHLPILIFLLPFVTAFILPLFRFKKELIYLLTCLSLVGSTMLSIYAIQWVQVHGTLSYKLGGWQPPFGIEWYLDGLSAIMALLITSLASIVILATHNTVDKEIHTGRVPYYMLVLLHISALLGMIFTRDFFNLFVFLEVASLTGYALIASGDRYRGNVASLRYLLIGTAGAILYLLGVGYLMLQQAL